MAGGTESFLPEVVICCVQFDVPRACVLKIAVISSSVFHNESGANLLPNRSSRLGLYAPN